MSNQDFFTKLVAASEANESLLCVGLDPTLDHIPPAFCTDDYLENSESAAQSMLRWNRAIIEATAHLACVYKPNIAFYEALGAAGHKLLHETLAAIPSHIPTLLDAKRSDIGNTARAYAQACFEHWQVDAVTLNPYLGKDSIQPFLEYPHKGLFVLCHTSNPGAADFQHLEISDWRALDREGNAPLYIHVARAACRWGPNVGLVVGATYPQAVQAVREAVPDAWLLVPGIGAQGGALEETVAAGARADGMGLLINVGRGISQAEDMAAAARRYRDAVNQARTARIHAGTRIHAGNDTHLSGKCAGIRETETTNEQYSGPPATTAPSGHPPVDAALDPETFLTALCIRLVELGAVQFGSFTLASGVESPIYIDLRLLVSDPPLLAQVAQAYAHKIAGLSVSSASARKMPIVFERLAGVPYAALPIGTAVALHTGTPMIYPRKEAKAYGLGRNIEGNWQRGERVLIIEDLMTSGGSIIKSAQQMREAGLVVEDCIVLIDRDQGGAENLHAAGIRAHSVFNIHDLLRILRQSDHIDAATLEQVTAFLRESRKT